MAVIAEALVDPLLLKLSICVCASALNVPIYCNSVLVTDPFANLITSTPVAIFTLVTASFAKSPTTIVPSSIIELSTLLAPMDVTPALLIVTSPLKVTS